MINPHMMYKVPNRTQLQTSETVYNKITNMWAWLWIHAKVCINNGLQYM